MTLPSIAGLRTSRMDTWDLMQNWHLVLPPSRPSAAQLNRIRSRIHAVPRTAPVAVLGSTPEFRDLLYECGFQHIFVLDRNLAFYKAMSEIRIYQYPEKLIEGDWMQTLSGFRGEFALILSDLTSGNIPYASRGEFYSLITDALRQGGLFCDKVLTHPGRNLSFHVLVEKYSNLPLNLMYVNYFSCEMLFCSELLDLEQLVDTSLFYSILDREVDNKRVRAFAEGAKKMVTPANCIWHYGQKWHALKMEYCPDLEVVSEEEDEVSSPYYGRLRFYVLQKP
jgi:hypothetical protein